ncbi:hypothetical protein HS1genome_0485 [Sulfodiicoccus acidiphilus]|uniref:Uncharacterized protein n=1 Tax=Sulfodiicoccus acidiphilus TaxID=1670455 RepID=A0A348B1P4_9CREN|nr:hypothetical protein [Sulfodiicoccus acidiphilus]BBD72096.1 hypothetical protein HS1genome_0485 [Sulfodiicoccus acidiphilus]GGU05126.1 hypothetical protein GCM10007116_22070 [Sulfodiicoccus acidiphilus]
MNPRPRIYPRIYNVVHLVSSMALFFRRGEQKIYHVNSLPEEMRAVLRSVMDGTLSDLATGYGLSYLSPKVGEPIFVHFGRLTGKFKDPEKAYQLLLDRISEAAQHGEPIYSQWFPKDLILKHYWITYYSYVDPEEGILPGIAAHPMAATAGDRFRLSERLQELSQLIKGKSVLIATPALTGQVYNRNSALWGAEPSKVTVYDKMWSRTEEVVQAFADEYEEFHRKVDNDKLFDRESSVRHMRTMLRVTDQVRSAINATDSLPERADVIIFPYFVIAPQFRVEAETKVKEAWNNVEGFRKLKEDGRFYELNSVYVLLNYQTLNSTLAELVSRYGGSKFVAVTDRKAPPLDKCASGECPKILAEMKVELERDSFKVLSP